MFKRTVLKTAVIVAMLAAPAALAGCRREVKSPPTSTPVRQLLPSLGGNSSPLPTPDAGNSPLGQ